MRARGLNKRIEIWETTQVSDGFGGYTTGEQLLSSSWAKIQTIQAGKGNQNLSDFGIIDGQNSILLTLRTRKDLVYNVETQFIKYRGYKYSISTAPTNIDFNDSIITFVAVRETTRSNVEGVPPATMEITEII